MSAQIPLTGSVGPTGPFAILGFSNPEITGNADHVLTVAEYSSTSLKVTSDGASLAIRKVVAPLAPGMLFMVENLTSEGLAITVGGASGTAVTVPSGSTVLVTCPDGANYVAPGGGAGSATIVANGAALTALPASGLPNGTQAVVQTFGALFALSAAGPTVDGVTVIAASDARVWQRGPSLIAEAAAAQTAWYVDSQNSSGTASDENSGLTALLPLLTKAEVIRRWGTSSPILTNINVVITYLSSEAGLGTDVGVFAPVFQNGASLRHTASFPPAAFTGVLLVVTPKSIVGNNALQSTFTTTTGAIVANMILVNVTRGNSVAYAQKNLGGGNWQISQPLTPYVPGTFPTPTQVDTWANGDTISGFIPLTLDFAEIGGIAASLPVSGAPQHIVERMNIVDSSGAGTMSLFIDAASNPIMSEVTFTRPVQEAVNRWNTNYPIYAYNCNIRQTINTTVSNLTISGGIIAGGNGVIHAILTNGVIFDGNTFFENFTTFNGEVFVDTARVLAPIASVELASTARIYGPGQWNQRAGRANYNATAVVTFPLAGGLLLLGVATGYSNATAAGLTTVHGGIALTPANLDAAAGAAGFGGYAYGPGASFTKAGVQP